MTTLEQFRAELLATGSYVTPILGRASHRAPPTLWSTLKLAWPVSGPFTRVALWQAIRLMTWPRLERMCFGTIRNAESLGMEVRLSGWLNRRAYSGPVVYVCNHMSSLETVMLPVILWTFGPLAITVKDSLLHLPLVTRRVAAFIDFLPVSRRNPREDLVTTLQAGVGRIQAGKSLLIFPQGTRQDVFDPTTFSSLGAKVAERAQVPLCPLVVDTRCLPQRKAGPFKHLLRDFGPVDTSRDIACVCGPLVPPGRSHTMHTISLTWMMDTLRELGLPIKGEGCDFLK